MVRSNDLPERKLRGWSGGKETAGKIIELVSIFFLLQYAGGMWSAPMTASGSIEQ